MVDLALPVLIQSNCGSGLAREEAVPVAISIADPPPSRASPLPQLCLCRTQILSTSAIPCGSEPARDGGLTVGGDLWDRSDNVLA